MEIKKQFDVIGVGSLTVDIFTDSPYMIIELRHQKTENFIALPTGKSTSSIVIRSGGSSGNTVAYLSKLGLKCGYFTKLGQDVLSEFLVEDLKKFKVDTSRILREKGLEAGKTVIVSTAKMKDTALIVDHGAADRLSVRDIKRNLDYLLSTKWLDITSFTSHEAIRAINFLMSKAKQKNVKIFFAPSKSMISFNPKETFNLLNYADAFSMNEEEALLLTKKNNLGEALRVLRKKASYGFVTRGKNGIIALFDGKFFKIKAYKVREIKNTTGAGDIAATWLLYGLINKWNIKDILNFAAVAGAFHVRKDFVGAKEGMPTFNEIKRYLDRVRNLPVRELHV